MKKIAFTVFIFIAASLHLFSQESYNVININPDPQGEPWIVEGYRPPRPESRLSQSDLHALRGAQLKSTDLPVQIDNSTQLYMRPVFSQIGGSCGSASRICYMLAYELNCYRNQSGSLPQNMLPSHFTWLLTDQYSSKEAMAKGTGVPNTQTYGGSLVSGIYGGDVDWPSLVNAPDYGWMNGYNKWYSAMSNRLEKSGDFLLDSPAALQYLKEWLHNHWEDTSFRAGGVAGAGCATQGAQYALATNGLTIVQSWGPAVDHGTTWAGYDDEVAFDFNGDGRITNNEDTNGDGRIDMLDWEKGALIMLNSWGPNWKNNGTVFVPYRLLKKDNMGAELYWIRKDYKPRRTIKVKMNYSARSELKMSVGIASDINASEPEKLVVCEHFNFAGNGKVPMLGRWNDGIMHTEDMEFGYDLTDLTEGYDATQPLKYFLYMETASGASGTGEVVTMSVLNYDTPEEQEVRSMQKNVTIENNGEITLVSVVMSGGKAIPSIYIPSKDWTIVSCNSEDPMEHIKTEKAIDGDETTHWHSRWSTGTDPFPHEIVVDMGKSYDLTTFEYLPRQDGGKNGHIGEYELYLSDDPMSWGYPVATGNWIYSSFAKEVSFARKNARYFKVVSLSEANGGPWSSASEFRFKVSDNSETAVGKNELLQLKVWYSDSQLNIRYMTDEGVVKVYNLQGQVVYMNQLQYGHVMLPIYLQKGIYIVCISTTKGHYKEKIYFH
ncbi:discoidin domain-containing protein [Saccharicrinis sp. GN24d3]|uniref:discoidin domain-containing protein n=1 Tax=Saccharicrinis sp. GN24d3 TaxID=3458416 RepID=UPI00403699E8